MHLRDALNFKLAWSKTILLQLFCLFTFLAGIALPCVGQIQTASGREISFETMDQFLKVQMDSLKLPALSIAFINDDKIIYHRALGVTDLKTSKKVDNQSLFEAASLSKPVFAYFVMRMVEKGKLDLDKPLYKYLPFEEVAHDQRYEIITARMVLDHTTGFPNWRWYDKKAPGLNVAEGAMYLKEHPGVFSYSGEGYHYLAKVVARVNGLTLKNLDSLFQREVAIPLGMKHSYYSWDKFIGQHKVTGYKDGIVFPKRWPAASPEEDSTIFGAASTLHTEAYSYANFLIAIMSNKGLKKQTIEEMLKTQANIPEEEVASWGTIRGWGLGFAIEPSEHGTRYSHGGDNGGFQAGMMFYKDQKRGYVYFLSCDKGGQFYVNLRNLLGEMH
jgi:CubicO group peptidase (beta-lactamase class C family)